MDPRRSPRWILNNHSKDQFPNLLGGGSPPNPPAGGGDHLPVQTETGTVPPDNRLGSHDDQRSFPSRPAAPGGDPEELVEWTYSWARMPTLQNGELLAECKIFEDDALVPAPNADQRCKTKGKVSKHGQNLYQNCHRRAGTMLLIFQSARLFANHTSSGSVIQGVLSLILTEVKSDGAVAPSMYRSLDALSKNGCNSHEMGAPDRNVRKDGHHQHLVNGRPCHCREEEK